MFNCHLWTGGHAFTNFTFSGELVEFPGPNNTQFAFCSFLASRQWLLTQIPGELFVKVIDYHRLSISISWTFIFPLWQYSTIFPTTNSTFLDCQKTCRSKIICWKLDSLYCICHHEIHLALSMAFHGFRSPTVRLRPPGCAVVHAGIHQDLWYTLLTFPPARGIIRGPMDPMGYPLVN